MLPFKKKLSKVCNTAHVAGLVTPAVAALVVVGGGLKLQRPLEQLTQAPPPLAFQAYLPPKFGS
jgi:hypothetical protein